MQHNGASLHPIDAHRRYLLAGNTLSICFKSLFIHGIIFALYQTKQVFQFGVPAQHLHTGDE
jgi:hypothetical protein